MLNDCVEERRKVDGCDIHIHRGHPFARGRVDDGRVELRRVRFQLDQQVEHFVVDAHRIRAGAIDLVDHDDGRAVQRQRLPQDEPRLRHGPVERINDEQDPIDHAKNALHFAAEVGVAGSVDDVDLCPLPANGCVFRQNGDPALALERIGVHHAFHDDLVLAKCASLPEHFVHESRLAVIDVRDNRDVSKFLLCHSLVR